MGRRKQTHPHRSGGLITEAGGPAQQLDKTKALKTEKAGKEDLFDIDKPYYVSMHRTDWISDDHLDISEVVLQIFNLREGFCTCNTPNVIYQDPAYSLRFRVCNVTRFIDRIKLGHWPMLSSGDIILELIDKGMPKDIEADSVIWWGSFDGPHEGVSGLVHLASMGFLTLRPVSDLVGTSSLRVRVEILKNAFHACESLLENTRQLWKKSMMNVIAWLRPEVMTSEARYGNHKIDETKVELSEEAEEESRNCRRRSSFDVAAFYEAIKPSVADPMLEDDIPDLLPVLRPYQRRAAYWMVHREKGDSVKLDEKERNQFSLPLCISVGFLDSSSKMFYNPFSGNISLEPEYFSPHVCGGILADEMGLGKTVELLACIFAHRKPVEDGVPQNNTSSLTSDQKLTLKRLKRERVECICGAVSESRKYKGLWVQCDICDSWQHADCVGFSPKGKAQNPSKVSDGQETRKRKKDTVKIVNREGEHICQMCSELLRATNSPVPTGATLIVCPAPILPQWHAEITRHMRPGSLRTCVYEGVRNTSLSDAPMIDFNELVNADIVLTTYDVLKEDLSHDSDRHEGDRRFLRFQKRYPVVPTLLTRIYWWRICLDEAQMVESNAAAATEMALRLYAQHCWCITGTPIQRKLDDLYGLLRFLKASPFNVSRWWIEVIRDPYERREAGAMEFMHRFFKQIMWRTSKVHVADELQLPPQEECISWLTFSAVEEHFYNRQHETCVSYAREVIESLKRDILKRGPVSSDDPLITHAEAAKLLNSLLKLRQACCHPQVGSSGLRSLQQAPMTMEEILMVLVNKTKTEGEEALRTVVVALNGLAAIAVLKLEFSEAVKLYKEALGITKEHAEDFRLDPLLNIHILHNLAEMLPIVGNCTEKLPSEIHHFSGNPLKEPDLLDNDQNSAKRRRIGKNEDLSLGVSPVTAPDHASDVTKTGLKKDIESDDECQSLKIDCGALKNKFLSGFSSKLSAAQQEFKKSYVQVCDAQRDMGKQHSSWWLDALQLAEQDKDFSRDLIRKIEEAIHGNLNNSNSSRVASRFRTIHGMKLHLQTCIDMLEVSRKKMIDRLLEIDQTMVKPKEEDFERISNCKYCQKKDDGPTCLHCELDGLFQDYEARLFRLNKSRKGIMESASAEEAVDLQKKNSELNHFFSILSSRNKDLDSSTASNEEPSKRNASNRVMVSKAASEMEVVLGVIKSNCKAYLDREGKLAATKQLQILEGMRKEYAYARALARAQAQFLCAHDEIKMATTRLQLREFEDDRSIFTLSRDELDAASVQNTNDKFLAVSSLLSIKGKLRYLKGLIKSKRKPESEISDNSSLMRQMATTSTSTKQRSECLPKAEEACPICQESLHNQKMVFQCGHVTCCKCLFSMTERRSIQDIQQKWVMCPICRQHTDVGNIAYADDSQNKRGSTSGDQGCEEHEASLTVQGSYGTKIEAVTRRILWIKSTDPQAKVLVFSSWNDVLDVLEHAFIANGITSIRMKGGRKSQVAISKFRGQHGIEKERNSQQKEGKSIQVLLLLIQNGANGLNLLEAQHVILVEPLLNPAAESQAVSRVHRIGQDKTTLVHRFIVKGTVEESIYKLNRSRNTNSSSFISGNTKNQDQPFLTLRDIESLFASVSTSVAETEEKLGENLRDLPPSVAAAIAAERRLKENAARSSSS